MIGDDRLYHHKNLDNIYISFWWKALRGFLPSIKSFCRLKVSLSSKKIVVFNRRKVLTKKKLCISSTLKKLLGKIKSSFITLQSLPIVFRQKSKDQLYDQFIEVPQAFFELICALRQINFPSTTSEFRKLAIFKSYETVKTSLFKWFY